MLVTTQWMRENYIKYNKMLFGGSLPENIEFKVNRRKTSWGLATYRMSKNEGKIRPLSISMSNYYDSPEEIKINTLIHEMIHIEDYTYHPEHFIERDNRWNSPYAWKKVSGRVYDAHGAWFQSECARINKQGFKVSVNVQEWEKEASNLSPNAQAAIDRRKANGAFVGFIRKINGKEPWFMIKTNETGMRKYINELLSHKEWYAKYTAYIEWYKTFDESVCNLSNTTKRGWFTSEIDKQFKIRMKHMELIDKTILNEDFVDTNGEKKQITDEEYINGLEQTLYALYNRIVNTISFKRNGKSSFGLTDKLTNISIIMSIDKNADVIRLTFDGSKTLGTKYSTFKSAENSGKYGKIVYNYLKTNNLIKENVMKDYKNLIRETINEFIANNGISDISQEEEGMRRYVKKIGDGEFIEGIE